VGQCSSRSLGCSKFLSGTTVPLILVSCLCYLLLLFNFQTKRNSSLSKSYRGKWKWIEKARNTWIIIFSGDKKIRLLTTVFVIIPTIVISVVHPLLSLRDRGTSFKDYNGILRAFGNPTGVGAVVSLSFFLVPVSRQSPMLVACGVNPIKALTMHIWAGRLCLWLALAHVSIYMLQYIQRGWKAGNNMWQTIPAVLFPKRECWNWSILNPLAYKNTKQRVESVGANEITETAPHPYNPGKYMSLTDEWAQIIRIPSDNSSLYSNNLIDCRMRGLAGCNEKSSTSDNIKDSIDLLNNNDIETGYIDVLQDISHTFPIKNSATNIDKIVSSSQQADILNASNFQCYGTWINFTGFVSVSALVLLCISSLNKIRRWSYRLFYYSHVFLGWTMLIFAILHWGPAGLYILPSVIYYLACTMPIVIQSAASYFIEGGVKIRKTTFLKNSNKCVEIIFPKSHAAHLVETKYSGPYVRICVPELSLMWHPFTVASTADDPSSLKILFRVYGPFTQKFYDRLGNCAQEKEGLPPPTILIDGYYGNQDWAQQALKHDSVLLVTGGIGVTPFLSMLSTLYASINNYNQVESRDMYSATTRRVSFHWICRDEGLIRHVLHHHIKLMMSKNNDRDHLNESNACLFDINIYYTARDANDTTPFFTDEDDVDLETSISRESDPSNSEDLVVIHKNGKGTDMDGSRFSIDRQFYKARNLPSLAVFSATAISAIAVVWNQNTIYIAQNRTASNLRVNQLYIIVGISIIVGVLANLLWYAFNFFDTMINKNVDRDLVENIDSVVLTDSDNSSGSLSESNGGSSIEDSDSYSPHKVENKERQSHSATCFNTLSFNEFPRLPHKSFVNGNSMLKVQVLNGRPNIDDIVLPVVTDVEKPGVFMCGPMRLLNEVKSKIRKKTWRCSVYEEEFEM